MTHARRQLLLLAVAAGAMPIALAWSQAYPTRLIRIAVPLPAGGPSDVLARLLARNLSVTLGQPVIVENRPGGAGGSVGVKAVARAVPDGYMLLLMPVDALIQASLVFKDVDYDPLKSFAPVASLVTCPYVVVVNPVLPVQTMQDLAIYARANPGKVAFASPGRGTQPHLMGELFKSAAGAEMIHVPFRGTAPAMNDLLAGQVQMLVDNFISSRPYIEVGKLRALAVTSPTRSPFLPQAPASVMTRHGNMFYVSGLPPFDPATGDIVKAPIERQTELVLEQLKLCMETAGSSLDNILMCTVYCTSVQMFAAVNGVYAKFFPKDPPARMFVNVIAHPGPFDIEIDCVASV